MAGHTIGVGIHWAGLRRTLLPPQIDINQRIANAESIAAMI